MIEYEYDNDDLDYWVAKTQEIAEGIGSGDRQVITDAITSILTLRGYPTPPMVFVQSPSAAFYLINRWDSELKAKLAIEDLTSYMEDLDPHTYLEEPSQPTAMYGSCDAHWICGNYRTLAMDKTIKFTDDEKSELDAYRQLAENAFWWWACEEATVVCERPSVLNIVTDPEDQSRIYHCEDGPAIQFADGICHFALNHILLPGEVGYKMIMTPELLTKDDVFGEENMEIRRLMMERMDMKQFLLDLHATKGLSDDWGTIWFLPEKNLPDSWSSDGCWVEVLNSTPNPDGSFKTYFLSVQPKEWKSPREAIASTFGLSEEEYFPQYMA